MEISFPAIQETALKGVRRTAVFMGLGLNAGRDPNYRAYQLSSISMMQFVPNNVDDATIDEFKTHFCHWIVGNGLRELIETFCVFLDELHDPCLLIKMKVESLDVEQFEKRSKVFRRKGLEEKLELLTDGFSIFAQDQDFLSTIYQARNCLTHRRGIVGMEDAENEQALEIRWRGLDLWIETRSGNKVPFDAPLIEPLYVEEGGAVKMQWVERTKTVPRGSVIELSGQELAEICHFVVLLSGQLVASATKFASESGVVVVNESKSS